MGAYSHPIAHIDLLQCLFLQNGEYPDGTVSQGGYSTAIRAHQQFVFPIPDAIESKHAASMLCGGLTVFSPLRTNGAGPGKKVGIIGIGGLGHYAILFAKALGAEVYAFTHTKDKMQDASELGADHVVDTTQKVRSAALVRVSRLTARRTSPNPCRVSSTSSSRPWTRPRSCLSRTFLACSTSMGVS